MSEVFRGACLLLLPRQGSQSKQGADDGLGLVAVYYHALHAKRMRLNSERSIYLSEAIARPSECRFSKSLCSRPNQEHSQSSTRSPLTRLDSRAFSVTRTASIGSMGRDQQIVAPEWECPPSPAGSGFAHNADLLSARGDEYQ